MASIFDLEAWVEPPHLPPDLDERFEEIQQTLLAWAQQHPNPDEPVYIIADRGELSAWKLARELAEPTKLGEAIVHSFAIGLTGGPPDALDQALAVYRQETEEQSRNGDNRFR